MVQVTGLANHGCQGMFTEEVEGDPTGFYSLAQPLLRQMVRRTIRRDFPVLKRILEAGA